MKFRIITISGEVCSGKSTIASTLAAMLPTWTRVNTGEKFREFCALQGMTIKQVSHLPDDIHRQFDDWQTKLLLSRSNTIVEGRLSGWLACELNDVLRVYCYASLDIRIQRYMEREKVPIDKAISDIEYRDKGDLEKFRHVYQISDYRDPHFYHLQVDTSKQTPVKLANIIIRMLNSYKAEG
jgi:cytidylate kinase